MKTATETAQALYDSGDTFHLDGDYEAFTARQEALWGYVATRSARFSRLVTDALRALTNGLPRAA